MPTPSPFFHRIAYLTRAPPQTSVGIPILGGLSTLAASYLARARGSGEPERSIVRAHDLDHFIRDAEAFLLDHGHLVGTEYNAGVQRFRERFEEIMGHNSPSNNFQQMIPKDLEAGLAGSPVRPMSPDDLVRMAAAAPPRPIYASIPANQTQPGQFPVSPMAQAYTMPGGYYAQPAQSVSPLAYVGQTGYANGGTPTQGGATVQVPQMATVPPAAMAGYPISQPQPVFMPFVSSTPMGSR